MASRPAASRTATGSTGKTRRNLFHHQLSRRPTSASTSTSGTTWQDPLPDNNSDIVVKDRNGNYDVQVPVLQPLLDEGQAREEDVISEKAKLDAMMLERYNDRSLQPGEPGELMAAVQASLRRKAASLDDDNWIFEAEQEKLGP